MLVYVPIPLNRVQVGKKLPVDAWTPQGRLLLRRGQLLQSEAHRDMLATHHASMTEADAGAWQKSLERAMRQMRAAGVGMLAIAQAPMPEEILEVDYLEGHNVDGGWLDLQEILRVLLYQGAQASSPLPRLQGIEQKAAILLKRDPDEALFVLFQALPDLNLGYCATHALLAGVVAALTAIKLARSEDSPTLLLRAALVMNIGMARPQDSLARQHNPPNQNQRQIITTHPPTSSAMLRGFGLHDDPLLELVQWHHAPEAASLAAEQQTSLHLLNLADGLVAKMAPRISRPAMLPLGAARALLQATSPGTADLRPAMAAVLGFYPPGTYVQLANGDIAVVIKRGQYARSPHVASIMNAKGMPLSKYVYHDTRDTGFEVRQPWASAAMHVQISLDKVRRLRAQHEI